MEKPKSTKNANFYTSSSNSKELLKQIKSLLIRCIVWFHTCLIKTSSPFQNITDVDSIKRADNTSLNHTLLIQLVK